MRHSSAGDLNYVVTQLSLAFLKGVGINYNDIALVTGVLTNVNQEFYRRLASPYEDSKIKLNGDVY